MKDETYQLGTPLLQSSSSRHSVVLGPMRVYPVGQENPQIEDMKLSCEQSADTVPSRSREGHCPI